MDNDYSVDYAKNKSEFSILGDAIPETMGAYGKLHHKTMAAGALDVKTKELIALGIGIHTKCEGCMIAHVKAAIRNGATQEEIAETVGVAIMMGGGPAVSYGSKAMAMAKQFGGQSD
jgi:AhpD family alkylhydroperoxidase